MDIKLMQLSELPVYAYYRDIGRFHHLDAGEEHRLASRIRQGDDFAVQLLVEANLRQAIRIAKRYEGMGVALEDLISAANIALIKAARRYNPEMHGRFMQHASWWIRQEIEAEFARTGRTLSIPPQVYAKSRKLQRKIERLEQAQGSSVSFEEASSSLGLGHSEIDYLLGASQKDTSLDVQAEGVEDPGVTMLDMLTYEDDRSPEQNAVASMFSERLDYAMTHLTGREQEVIRMTFGLGNEEVTIEEAGKRIGVSSQKARELRKKALRKLRSMEVLRKFQ
jgi:RNA polymerase primary sigma factor